MAAYRCSGTDEHLDCRLRPYRSRRLVHALVRTISGWTGRPQAVTRSSHHHYPVRSVVSRHTTTKKRPARFIQSSRTTMGDSIIQPGGRHGPVTETVVNSSWRNGEPIPPTSPPFYRAWRLLEGWGLKSSVPSSSATTTGQQVHLLAGCFYARTVCCAGTIQSASLCPS